MSWVGAVNPLGAKIETAELSDDSVTPPKIARPFVFCNGDLTTFSTTSTTYTSSCAAVCLPEASNYKVIVACMIRTDTAGATAYCSWESQDETQTPITAASDAHAASVTATTWKVASGTAATTGANTVKIVTRLRVSAGTGYFFAASLTWG